MVSIPAKKKGGSQMKGIGVAIAAPFVIFVLLGISAEIEGQKEEYAQEIVFGTIVSNGVIESSRSATGSIDPVVMVKSDDGKMIRVPATSSTASADYRLIQGERVRIVREKVMALIPFLTNQFKDRYRGWLKPFNGNQNS